MISEVIIPTFSMLDVSDPGTIKRLGIIPASRSQRQMDLCDSEASLVYIESYRTVRTT